MSKTLVLGDIHGRTIWKDIIAKEDPDKVIFLGDYVSSHDGIPAKQQLNNLWEILEYQWKGGKEVIMLRGNHDMQHIGYHWAECSGFNRDVYKGMQRYTNAFLKSTQWIYIQDKTIFSHAGVSQVWLDNCGLTLEQINDQEPSEMFGFIPDNMMDTYGTSPTQPPTWIRPQTLAKCTVEGYGQVVGHTTMRRLGNISMIVKNKQDLWLCDTLGVKEYLIIEDGEFKPCKL